MFTRLARIISANSKYIWLGTLLFVGGSLLGYFNATLMEQVAKELMQQLEKIGDKIGEQGGGPLSMFWVIFQNNVLASLTMLGLGIFFCVFPVFALISNGILLGFMLKAFSMKGLNPLLILVVGILPHGIVELFAVILAAGLGIKYGTFVIRMFGNLFSNKRAGILTEFKENLEDLPFIVVSLIAMLFVAAVIESVVTPFLIYSVFGDLAG
ncbi:hypothetical protein BEP19_10415 [Ammoniphilus oxalaticus]|uniref:Stage II sporulation protein M n=1 Tax=Ammoniphilus oxalaticus TaxID=66863 RepID=A0A419SFU3_9BACL|nr:stage II sporulation protein M [Ammoniphilus oxalaticus]RKD22661.1 hypothetical protein BEP19_10415 [Ammoniphilus oxalaticus]